MNKKTFHLQFIVLTLNLGTETFMKVKQIKNFEINIKQLDRQNIFKKVIKLRNKEYHSQIRDISINIDDFLSTK